MAERIDNDRERLNTIIGQGTVLRGECEVNGTVRVDGIIDGSLSATGMAILGKSGQIRGDLLVQDAVVGGKIDGSVIARGKLELQTGASVDGDINARKLVVEEGVFFQGRCSMDEDSPGHEPVRIIGKAEPIPDTFEPEKKENAEKNEEPEEDSDMEDITFRGKPI